MRLTPEDQQVVDLLLDGSGQFDGARDAHFKERLNAAQRVLKTLDAMGAMDPSTNLIDLTLQRCEDAAHRTGQVADAHQFDQAFIPPTGL
jgi:hypothetical protein